MGAADRTANDVVLGTSAHKIGPLAAMFKPVGQAGSGILPGCSRCMTAAGVAGPPPGDLLDSAARVGALAAAVVSLND